VSYEELDCLSSKESRFRKLGDDCSLGNKYFCIVIYIFSSALGYNRLIQHIKQMEHTVGEKKIVASAGDVFTVGPNVYHHATNIGSKDAHMFVAYSAGNRVMKLED
jgi:hypothetical protein